METLFGLLDEGRVDERLMNAELLRQLGEFETAKALLSTIEAPEYADAVAQIRGFCNLSDARVRLLDR